MSEQQRAVEIEERRQGRRGVFPIWELPNYLNDGCLGEKKEGEGEGKCEDCREDCLREHEVEEGEEVRGCRESGGVEEGANSR